MNHSAPLPSQRLHWLAWLARWVLRATLAAWTIFLLAWGGLHLVIVPRIPQWSAHVERWASHAIGAPVRIGQLQTQANGLFPTLLLQDVRILDAQQRPALQLPKVVLTISPRSLLRGGLEQLLIEAPHLQVRHLADGRWQIAGLVLDPAGPGDSSQGMEWLLEQPELAVLGGQIQFTDETGQTPPMHLQDVRLVLRGSPWHHALRLDAQDDQGQQLHAAGTGPRAIHDALHAPGALFQQPLRHRRIHHPAADVRTLDPRAAQIKSRRSARRYDGNGETQQRGSGVPEAATRSGQSRSRP